MQKLAHHDIPRVPADDIGQALRHPVVLLLDNIRSAHNVGSAFRSSDGACIEEIIVSGITPDPDHKAALKTALGAHEYVPWKRTDDVPSLINRYKDDGYLVAALRLQILPHLSHHFLPMTFHCCW